MRQQIEVHQSTEKHTDDRTRWAGSLLRFRPAFKHPAHSHCRPTERRRREIYLQIVVLLIKRQFTCDMPGRRDVTNILATTMRDHAMKLTYA